MASIVTFMGLMCMANALFVLNYFFVRSLRCLTDTRAMIQNIHVDGNESSLPDGDAPNDTAEEASDSSREDIAGRRTWLSGAIYAFFVGGIGTHPLASKRFPDWHPIPWRVGILSTSLLMILFAIFFSEPVLNDRLGLDPADTSPQRGLCQLDERDQKVQHLERTFAQESNIEDARAQSYHTKRFFYALREDTALYGEPSYPCSREPRTKQAFRTSDAFGGALGLHFFPGYCEAAHRHAMERAKNQMCSRTVCKGAEIIQDYDIRISFEAFVPGIVAMALGVPCVPPVKPKVTVTPVYGYEEFCQNITVACPDFSAADETEEVVQDYAIEQFKYAEKLADEQLKNVQVFADRNDTETSSKDGVVHELLYQIDVASNIYIVYAIVALLFPAPLIILRSTYFVAFKRLVFGVQRPFFIAIVLATWWGIKFFQAFHIMEYYDYYVNYYLKEPCIADPEYMLGALKAYTATCDEVIELKSNWTLETGTIGSTLEMVDMMKDCGCNYPFVHIEDLMPAPEEFTEMEERVRFGLGAWNSHMCGGATNCLVLSPGATFLGNDSMCHNTTYVEEQIMQMAAESDATWWEVWIASGILATLLVKMASANFGLAILNWADPFSFCNGEFEWPNTQYGSYEELRQLKQIKETYLKMRSTRIAFFWGLLMNLCMLNVAASAFYRGIDEIKDNDIKVGTTLIVVSLVPVLLGVAGAHFVKKSMIQLERAARSHMPVSTSQSP